MVLLSARPKREFMIQLRIAIDVGRGGGAARGPIAAASMRIGPADRQPHPACPPAGPSSQPLDHLPQRLGWHLAAKTHARTTPKCDLDHPAAPCSRARLGRSRHDRHRRHPEALLGCGRRRLRRHLAPPFENRVGVDIMTPPTIETEAPGSSVSATIRRFHARVPWRRLPPSELRLVSTAPLVDTSVALSTIPRSSRRVEGYTGVLQTDGYAGCRALADPKRTGGTASLAFCWSH